MGCIMCRQLCSIHKFECVQWKSVLCWNVQTMFRTADSLLDVEKKKNKKLMTIFRTLSFCLSKHNFRYLLLAENTERLSNKCLSNLPMDVIWMIVWIFPFTFRIFFFDFFFSVLFLSIRNIDYRDAHNVHIEQPKNAFGNCMNGM